MKGILGKKVGMTQVFVSDGRSVPVTVVSVEPNVVTLVRTKEKDGYDAIQLGFETIKEKSSNKAKIGHTKKANSAPKRFLKEIRNVDVENYTLGQEIKIDIFAPAEYVDVTGISKGKGFQGVIKRFNQTRGPMSHGSQYHRGVGSLGTMLPKRVLPGKQLPGHMGSEQVTVQNLEIIAVDLENNCLLIKGNVPGPKGSLVIVKSASKKQYSKTTSVELISYSSNAEEIIEPVEEAIEESVDTTDSEESSQE